MAITQNEVQYVAKLARIGLSEKDTEKFTQELNSILHWIDALNEIKVPDDLPLSIPTDLIAERADDQPSPDISAELMRNAPDALHNFFAVPKVIEA